MFWLFIISSVAMFIQHLEVCPENYSILYYSEALPVLWSLTSVTLTSVGLWMICSLKRKTWFTQKHTLRHHESQEATLSRFKKAEGDGALRDILRNLGISGTGPSWRPGSGDDDGLSEALDVPAVYICVPPTAVHSVLLLNAGWTFR